MEKHVFVARQPIMTQENVVFGYELLFRGCNMHNFTPVNEACFDETFATAHVVTTVMNQFGLENVVGDMPAFINIDHHFIFDALIEAIPPKLFIFEILENITVTQELIDRVKQLRSLGYRFALDDVVLCEDFFGNYGALFQHIEIFKIDIELSTMEQIRQWAPRLKLTGTKILAEKVETKEAFDTLKSLGFDLFQGYYFARPAMLKHTSINPQSKAVLQIIADIDQGHTTQEIVKRLHQETEISIQLIRFINSAHASLKNPITSIHQTITLLGLKPLRQWLLMLAFSQAIGTNDPAHHPIFLLAKSRALLMGNIMRTLTKDKEQEYEGSFVGLLSLLDALFQIPIENLLVELNVADIIIQAILHQAGTLGIALKLAIAVERFDQKMFPPLAVQLGLSIEDFEKIVLESF